MKESIDKLTGASLDKEEPKTSASVLKISEMALSIDGKYVGEIDNPSYKDKEDMFEYDPEEKGGLLVNGQKETKILKPTDLVLLPSGLGHITIDGLLGSKGGQYSSREFERKIYAAYESLKNQIDKIIYIAKTAGINLNEDTINFRCVETAAKNNPQYSPEELIEAIFDELKKEKEFLSAEIIEEKGLNNIIEEIRKTDLINENPGESKRAIVSYFYLYCRLKKVDISAPSALVRGLEDFQYVDELIKEYEKNPDNRFSDELLVACSEFTKLGE